MGAGVTPRGNTIVEGLRLGRLKDGDLMVIVAAGIGYAWGAACVRWG
jgi:3-oxoacyl-[acyl-carrier-protein] synthase-3